MSTDDIFDNTDAARAAVQAAMANFSESSSDESEALDSSDSDGDGDSDTPALRKSTDEPAAKRQKAAAAPVVDLVALSSGDDDDDDDDLQSETLDPAKQEILRKLEEKEKQVTEHLLRSGRRKKQTQRPKAYTISEDDSDDEDPNSEKFLEDWKKRQGKDDIDKLLEAEVNITREKEKDKKSSTSPSLSSTDAQNSNVPSNCAEVKVCFNNKESKIFTHCVNSTFDELAIKVAEWRNTSKSSVRLYFDGELMNSNSTLEDEGIETGDEVQIDVKE
jgi:hypothetical protein